jgi:hypothetical protein
MTQTFEADMVEFEMDLMDLITENFMPPAVKDDEYSRSLYLAKALENIKEGMWTGDEYEFHQKEEELNYTNNTRRMVELESDLDALVDMGVDKDKVYGGGMNHYLLKVFDAAPVWQPAKSGLTNFTGMGLSADVGCYQFVNKHCQLFL